MASLSVNDQQTLFGANGAQGARGAGYQGTNNTAFHGVDGEPASDGAAGGAAFLLSSATILTGTKAADSITIARTAVGGGGGAGGIGGDGARPALLAESSTYRNYISGIGEIYDTYRRYGDAGDGGAGGDGGGGGAATPIVGGITLRLAQAGGAPDTVLLASTAYGGHGGKGGAGGHGGPYLEGLDNFSGRQTEYRRSEGAWAYAGTDTRSSGQGGDGGARGDGGQGGHAEAAIVGVTLSGRSATVTLQVVAQGGEGGHGGDVGIYEWGQTALGQAGNGGTGGNGADGGQGDQGGDALARIEQVTATFREATTLDVQIAARGGRGGEGGDGSGPGFGITSDIAQYFTPPNISYIDGSGAVVAGVTGNAGDGGSGGDALARMVGNTFTFDAGADTARIQLSAIGAGGGAGGDGIGPEDMNVGPTEVIVYDGASNGGYTYTVTNDFADATLDGAVGNSGTGRIEMLNNRIALGGGDDVLALSLEAYTAVTSPTYPGWGDSLVIIPLNSTNLSASGNRFDGGIGWDTLNLSGIKGGGTVLDVSLGTLKIGGVTLGKVLGFEAFRGTTNSDRFFDAAGDQLYAGGNDSVRDTFVFGHDHGHDTIGSPELGFFGPGDKIDVKAFGAAFNTIQEVRAATQDLALGGGCVIDTPDGGSITLAYVAKAQLTASMFLFA